MNKYIAHTINRLLVKFQGYVNKIAYVCKYWMYITEPITENQWNIDTCI